jgi:hypothetical protein
MLMNVLRQACTIDITRVETLPFGYACGTPDGERQSPGSGNPPAALDSHAMSLALVMAFANCLLLNRIVL